MTVRRISIGDTKNWDTLRARLNENFFSIPVDNVLSNIDVDALPTATDNDDAVAKGIPKGQAYMNGDVLQVCRG